VRDINIVPYKTTKNDYVSNKTRISHGFIDRNYNSFAPLLDYNVECYNCNNYVHITRDRRSNTIKKKMFLPNIKKNT
jgi:hypothetical protein